MSLNFSELLKALGESAYGPDLTGDSVSAVDRAVTRHLSRTVTDLPRLVSGEVREAVRLMLLGGDLSNVKTVLRGRFSGWSPGEIAVHLEGGTLSPGLFSAMAEAPDAQSLAQILSLAGHPLARILRETSRISHEPLEVELSLNHAFYREVLRLASELGSAYLIDFFRFEIDAVNLAAGFKLSTVGFEGPPDRFFVRGGRRIGLSLFYRLAGGEIAALQELHDTDFALVAEARDLISLERGLRCALMAKAREGAKDVLGPGLVNDYVHRKEWEGCRIRLLARRAYYNLPPASVEQEIFCQ